MPRRDAVLLASRTLAVLLTVLALVDLSYLPERLHSFLHYTYQAALSEHVLYLRHSYLVAMGFLITRIIGLFLMATWLHRCGPDVQELLFPGEPEES